MSIVVEQPTRDEAEGASGVAAPPSRSLATRVLVPFGAFLASNLVLWASAARNGFDFFNSRLWVQWDARIYLEIARSGYTLYSCRFGDPVERASFAPDKWCGSAGWFPGFPMMVKLLERAGVSGPLAGVLIATSFQLTTLMLLWNVFLVSKSGLDNLLGLGLAAFFFGFVYYHAVFPISATAFFILLSLWFLSRERWLPAGLAGFAAAFLYPTGAALAAVAGFWVLWKKRGENWKELGYRVLATSGLTLGGLGAVLIMQRITTGAWGAFYLVQSRYGSGGPHNPMAKFVETVRPAFRHGYSLAQAASWQTLVVGLFIVSLLVAVGVRVRHGGSIAPVEELAVIAMVLFWLVPMMVGADVHLYRAEALLLPAVLVFRHMPRWGQVVFLWAALWLAHDMALLFYAGVLI